MASPIATTRSLLSTASSRQAASVRPLRTSSPMASKSPWTPASKLSLNSTVLTVEPDKTEPRRVPKLGPFEKDHKSAA